MAKPKKAKRTNKQFPNKAKKNKILNLKNKKIRKFREMGFSRAAVAELFLEKRSKRPENRDAE